jgi:hypothetical protein
MLSLLLLTQFAFATPSASVTCTPPTHEESNKSVAICGEDRIPTFTDKKQKVSSVTLLFHDPARGIERSVAVKTPGLTVTQVNKTELSSSKAVQKEIELIRKEWKIKNLKYEVLLFEIDSKAPLYATKDLKTKMALSKIARKINRTVASEGPPSVGGVGRAQKASEH